MVSHSTLISTYLRQIPISARRRNRLRLGRDPAPALRATASVLGERCGRRRGLRSPRRRRRRRGSCPQPLSRLSSRTVRPVLALATPVPFRRIFAVQTAVLCSHCGVRKTISKSKRWEVRVWLQRYLDRRASTCEWKGAMRVRWRRRCGTDGQWASFRRGRTPPSPLIYPSSRPPRLRPLLRASHPTPILRGFPVSA